MRAPITLKYPPGVFVHGDSELARPDAQMRRSRMGTGAVDVVARAAITLRAR